MLNQPIHQYGNKQKLFKFQFNDVSIHPQKQPFLLKKPKTGPVKRADKKRADRKKGRQQNGPT
jgi:hypothetical protein